MEKATGTVWAVVPNHNGGTELHDRLRELAELPVIGGVIAVDDRSSDGSLRSAPCAEVTVLENRGRRGFAATVNVGLRHLLESANPPEYVAIANSDLSFDATLGEALEAAVHVMDEMSEYGLCGFTERARADAGAESGGGRGWREAASVPGCIMLVRMRVVAQLGYLDEGYFMYGEENDYFHRLRRNGVGILHLDASVVHEGEGSRLPGLRTTWLAHRNAVRCAVKDLSMLAVCRTVVSLVALPYFRSRALVDQDPSLRRTLRFGPLVGSALGLASVVWNLWHLVGTVRSRLAEDRFIRSRSVDVALMKGRP